MPHKFLIFVSLLGAIMFGVLDFLLQTA